MSKTDVTYREEQRFRQWWVWIIVLGVGALGWWLLVQQLILGQPLGDEPMPDWAGWLVWAMSGVGLPLLFWNIRLLTKVTTEQLIISFRPLGRRTICLADIREASVRTYNPIKEYGGWGIKGWSTRNVAYNASGNRGVQLVLGDGRKVMVGSQRPEELARALASARDGLGRKVS